MDQLARIYATQLLLQGMPWELTVFGSELTSEEVYASYASGRELGYETHSCGKDTSLSAYIEEGRTREITNGVQKRRRAVGIP
ncbi:hypothetical protein Y032_0077g1080 [Ancylostoma ceylanicum]|uniref:Uncharacterized protein n=1 Tax=Ancylostoma ceylanicum TaxID=53326 RepID=A0A016TUX0_9BILA|nr:hypothetical protein Y032_0077g1080 [Ancylostoma ceylanicum]